MGEDNKGNGRENQARTIATAKIIERDELVPSPEARAGWIFKFLKDNCPELNDWDLICFCAEYLGSQLHEYPWLEKDAVVLIARRVNFAHYTFDEEPQSGIQ